MATFEKQPGLEAVQPHSHLSVNEKSNAVTSDHSSSQISAPGDYDGDLPDPDVGKTDEERAALVRPLHLYSLAIMTLTPHRTKHS
jgi:hypothetical protein